MGFSPMVNAEILSQSINKQRESGQADVNHLTKTATDKQYTNYLQSAKHGNRSKQLSGKSNYQI